MLEFVTTLIDEELDAVAAGASVSFTLSATARGLTQADIVGRVTANAETTKTTEAADGEAELTVTTA
jgi:hypothetical protein